MAAEIKKEIIVLIRVNMRRTRLKGIKDDIERIVTNIFSDGRMFI
jgi:hypothetical protein